MHFIQRLVSFTLIGATALLVSAAVMAAQDLPAPSSAVRPTIPDTPAGRALRAWLAAFSAHDANVLTAYLTQYEPSAPVDEERSLWNQISGVQLVAITRSSARHIEFQLRSNDLAIRGKIDVDDSGRPVISPIILRLYPPDVPSDEVTLDKTQRHNVIEGIIEKIIDSYVDSDLAAKMRSDILRREAAGEYDAISDGDILARRLTDDLRGVSHDKHLVLTFSPYRVPPLTEDVDFREPTAEERLDMLGRNCGFERIEILPHNVGYMKVNSFEDPDICGATVAAAMAFVGNVNALIFDLRENRGGDPQTVQLLESYLFAEPTHLNDQYERRGNKTTQYWSLPYLPGKRIVGKPVYVLTSGSTFSAGEEFSYDLQNLKRAVIVGEQTGGGAHPVSGHQVATYFTVFVPFARAINPVSKTDWEGVGVEPDVKVPAADALEKAQSTAADDLNKLQPSRKLDAH